MIIHPSVAAAMPEEKTFRRAEVYYCISQTGREFLSSRRHAGRDR